MEQANKLELESTQTLVENILLNSERARNDDKYLVYEVLQNICRANGSKMFIPFELFEVFPSFETITRIRRKLQNERHLYLPSVEVIERRTTRENDFKEWNRATK